MNISLNAMENVTGKLSVAIGKIPTKIGFGKVISRL